MGKELFSSVKVIIAIKYGVILPVKVITVIIYDVMSSDKAITAIIKKMK